MKKVTLPTALNSFDLPIIPQLGRVRVFFIGHTGFRRNHESCKIADTERKNLGKNIPSLASRTFSNELGH